jgi:serine/threonine-protein kinase
MAIADLGACEWFVMELRRSGLIERGQLDQVIGDYLRKTPRTEPKALAEFLVEGKVLSKFQADRILAGKAAGLVLGPYTLVDAIGSGSMGTVYKAHSKTDGLMYAVKVLPRRSMWNVRLARRQVRSFSQFNHPSIVPFVDVGTAGGLHYLAWPFAEGEPLETRIGRVGKLRPDVGALFALQLAHGLSVAHQNGLFHGLLKPSNVLISPDQTAKILDFGIGSLLVENEGESLVDTMSTANTLTSGLDCSSPESILEPTNRTPAGDQYSLGCMLYYCLTGRYPFEEGSAVEKMMAHQSKDPLPIRQFAPDVPDGLAAIVERLMQKKPDNRFGLIDEVVDALQPFATEPSRAGRETEMLTETPRPDMTTVTTRPIPQPNPAATPAPRPVQRPRTKTAQSTGDAAAKLPAGVRRPSASGDKNGVKPVPSYQKTDDGQPTAHFGSTTLVLTGMALVCIAYLGLTYFHILR